MSSIRKHARLLTVGTCCAAAGVAGGAIASAGASTPAHGNAAHGNAVRAHVRGPLRRFAARAVHGDVVVHTRSGFVTVTFDRGTVDTVNGRQLTIAEGTARATYKTVTLTIPASARVRDDRQPATLAQVKPGQRVIVVAAPKRMIVIARSPRHG